MVRPLGWEVRGPISILAHGARASLSPGLPSYTSREIIFSEPFKAQSEET